jgi:electron-transferring-flavoprotein dehydrogenase
LLEQRRPFTRENLQEMYIRRRRESFVDREARVAADSRNGFASGVVTGMIGMALAGFTRGRISLGSQFQPLPKATRSIEDTYKGRLSTSELQQILTECSAQGTAAHDRIMDRCGWPEIPLDGKLLISHQDALLTGGGVQAAAGYANHVVFIDPALCHKCSPKLCVEMCSGQAITRGEGDVPAFDREKCVYCGACLWNCRQSVDGEHGNIEFRAGSGGLHSTLN